jgi:AcrR family transcriptional regulator
MGARSRAPSEQAAPDWIAPARNGLGREHPIGHAQVAEVQRARMLTAMVELAAERGAANVTVAHVVELSGVSRRTFYELFDDREDCLLAALEDVLARASERVVPAYESGDGWAERIRLALAALLAFLDANRSVGRLLVVESLGAGAEALERRERVLVRMSAAIDEGRAQVRRGVGPPPLTAEGVVGAVLSVVHSRLLRRDPAPLTELAGPLMGTIVLPYLGPVAARRELSRPTPESARAPASLHGDPLRDIELRLTYRTLRVLMELGERPGASNRQIGNAAGIADQGQISKLLARLERVELIENALDGRGRGGPNAWALTARGRSLERSVRERSSGPAR